MKAIPTPTKEQCARVAQEVQQEAMLSVYDNVAMLLIALGRKYGFRQKKRRESQQLSIKEQIEAERLREKMFALRDFTEGKL